MESLARAPLKNKAQKTHNNRLKDIKKIQETLSS